MSAQQDGLETSAADLFVEWLAAGLRAILATGRPGIMFAVAGAVIGTAVALVLPLRFTSEASFIAQGASTSMLPSALQGLAASVGLSSARDFSPQFYAKLLTSE